MYSHDFINEFFLKSSDREVVGVMAKWDARFWCFLVFYMSVGWTGDVKLHFLTIFCCSALNRNPIWVMGDDDRAQPFFLSILFLSFMLESLLCWLTIIEEWDGLMSTFGVLTIATIFLFLFLSLMSSPLLEAFNLFLRLKLNYLVKYVWPDDPFVSHACLFTTSQILCWQTF